MSTNSDYQARHILFKRESRYSGLQITKDLEGRYVRRTAEHGRTGDRSYMEEIFYVVQVTPGNLSALSMDTRYGSGGKNKRVIEFSLSEYQDGAWEIVDVFTGEPAIDYAIKILKAAGVSPELYADFLKQK